MAIRVLRLEVLAGVEYPSEVIRVIEAWMVEVVRGHSLMYCDAADSTLMLTGGGVSAEESDHTSFVLGDAKGILSPG